MKFSSLALASLILGFGNAINPKSFLRHARRLDQQEDEEPFEITGDYTIKFNACASLQVLDIESANEYVETAQGNGNDGSDVASSLKMYKDYVIFDAYNSNTGESYQYAIDVPSYVQGLVQYTPNEREEYCETCQEIVGFCLTDDMYAQQNQNDGGRNLVVLNCQTCDANGCFDEQKATANNYNNGDDAEEQERSWYVDEDGYTSTEALEWFSTLAECQAISEDNGYVNQSYSSNNNGDDDGQADFEGPYASLICNQEGTGVEIGIFSNEDCTLASSSTTFYDIIASEPSIKAYIKLTKQLVENSFTQKLSCMSQEYSNPFYSDNEDGDNQAANDDEAEEEVEANEICKELTEEESIEITGACYEEGDDDAQQDKYAYDDNGNPWGTYVYQVGNDDDDAVTTWSTTFYYDIMSDGEGDMEEVCVALQAKAGGYASVFSQSSSYNIYDYSGQANNEFDWTWTMSADDSPTSSPGNSWKDTDWQTTSKNIGKKVNDAINTTAEQTGLKVEEVVAITIGVLAGICLFCVVGCFCCRGRRSIKGDPSNSVSLIGKVKQVKQNRKHWKPALDDWNGKQDDKSFFA